MELTAYFESKKGIGVLSTADHNGKVGSALYARPHVLEDGTLLFIMRDRLMHANLQSNPQAAYLFVEEGQGCKGKRFFLTKISEEVNAELVAQLSRRTRADKTEETKYIAVFRIDEELPLLGGAE
ncbi:MAG: pyridoxamine 5'-phosphate oxidase family protein [Pseudomonadota bacterium]